MSENGKETPKTNGTDMAVPTLTVEPLETDPCVVPDNDTTKEKLKHQNRNNNNIFYRYRDEISKRSGLSHRGVYFLCGIVFLSFGLFVIMIALAAAWPTVPHKYQYPVCQEAECLRSAAQVQEALDRSVSPCENLWQATCGGWLQKYRLPKDKSIWNQKQQQMQKEAEWVRDLIATFDLPLHINTVEWKMKHLYESCMDVGTIKMDDERPLMSIISALGGWYILRDFNEDDFDKFTVLTSLHVKYGATPFFKISVEPHPNMPGNNVIRISPSGLGLPDKEYYYREEDDRIATAYKEYIRDVVIYLSTARNEATKFGTDIFSYEKRIAEITPDRRKLLNPITTFNAISISELKETNLIPFYDIIQVMFPDTNISEDTEIVVTSPEYLGNIAQIISTTDRRTMNGYLIWTLVRTYIPYLQDKFTSAMDTFHSELLGIQQPLERWEMCSGLVNRFMGLATNVLMEKSKPLSDRATGTVKETFVAIKNVVAAKLSNFERTDFLYNHLKSKVANLKLRIGVPKNFTNEKFLKNYYNTLKIMKSNMFEGIKNAMVFEKKLEEKKLATISGDDNILSYISSDMPKVHYSPSDHSVIVPKRLLIEPYFEDRYPSSVIYGRLGIEIAEAIVSSILPYDSLWTADMKILSLFHDAVNESMYSIHPSTKCLSEYILNLNLAVPSVIANETALNTLKHIEAVKIASEALLNSKKTEHIHQPSLEEFENSGLFFITYAQTQCSESTSQYQLYDNIMEFQLPQRSRLHLTWTQLREFPEAFECSFNGKLQCPLTL